MADYIIMTDSDSDLPLDLQVKYNIPYVSMPYTLNGREYFDDLGQTINAKEYYDAMRSGAVPTTSALNEQNYLDYFEPILKEHDLLFLAFSSKMSRTIESARAAQAELLEKYPERKLIIVDTLSISIPQTLLVIKAYEMRDAGATIEEVAAWVEQNYMRANAFFTVDDLKYLQRGGRVSTVAAAMGTLLDLKPILIETKEGTLVSCAKVRGRKKAVNFIVEQSVAAAADNQTECVGIVLHADVQAEAEKLKATLQEKLPQMTIRIDNIGPVIGAHAGPGTLAFCFLGKERPQ